MRLAQRHGAAVAPRRCAALAQRSRVAAPAGLAACTLPGRLQAPTWSPVDLAGLEPAVATLSRGSQGMTLHRIQGATLHRSQGATLHRSGKTFDAHPAALW